MIKQVFWDKKINVDEVYAFLNGKIDQVPHISSKSIYIKFLTTYPWHILIELLSPEVLREALQDDVINSLFPPELRTRYRCARQKLFEVPK